MHIIVLGGAGAMGRIAVRTLTEYSDVDLVTIADYNAKRAHEVAASLPSSNIQIKQIDVNDEEHLRALLRGADVVLNAVEYIFNLPILKACIQEKVHYADLGGLFHMTRKLMNMHAEVEEAGITAILGVWYPQQPLSGQEEMVFPLPVGHATAVYSLHSECATFPISFRDKGIDYVSFKIAFPTDFMTKLKFLVDLGFGSDEPITVRGNKVSPREVLARLLEMAPVEDVEPQDCDVLRTGRTILPRACALRHARNRNPHHNRIVKCLQPISPL